MKAYSFTGHLSPLPPGIKLPLELSGTVYLPHDVDERVAQYEAQIEQMRGTIVRLNADLASLKGTLRAMRRSARDKKRNAQRR